MDSREAQDMNAVYSRSLAMRAGIVSMGELESFRAVVEDLSARNGRDLGSVIATERERLHQSVRRRATHAKSRARKIFVPQS